MPSMPKNFQQFAALVVVGVAVKFAVEGIYTFLKTNQANELLEDD